MTSYSTLSKVSTKNAKIGSRHEASITPPAVTADVQVIVNLANVLTSADFVAAVNQCKADILKVDPFTNG